MWLLEVLGSLVQVRACHTHRQLSLALPQTLSRSLEPMLRSQLFPTRPVNCHTHHHPHTQVRDTLDIDAARSSYYTSLFPLNPSGITPSGPTAADLNLNGPVPCDEALGRGRPGGSTLEEVTHSRV